MKKQLIPKVSVIMAVYNGMPYLKESVESILIQTFKNFEFIIVDDASIDGTWGFLRALKDKRIKLVKNKRNLGLASSLNKALKFSKGNFIARIDADDISLPQRLEIQINFLQKNQNIDICGTLAYLINEEGKKIGEVQKPTKDKDIKKMNQWITGLIHPTWLAKREVFDELGGYDPEYDMVEDYDFLIRAKNFGMANINKKLLLWRSPRNRRSQKNIEKMYRKSLFLRWHYFKKGEFGILYFPYILRSIITTYLFPTKIKIFLNKMSGLI